MVKYKGDAILTGGNSEFGKTASVISMKIQMGKWKRQPSMNQKRANHACAIMHSEAHSGRPIVVVAGGGEKFQDNTEFWDFTLAHSTWQSGKSQARICSQTLILAMLR